MFEVDDLELLLVHRLARIAHEMVALRQVLLRLTMLLARRVVLRVRLGAALLQLDELVIERIRGLFEAHRLGLGPRGAVLVLLHRVRQLFERRIDLAQRFLVHANRAEKAFATLLDLRLLQAQVLLGDRRIVRDRLRRGDPVAHARFHFRAALFAQGQQMLIAQRLAEDRLRARHRERQLVRFALELARLLRNVHRARNDARELRLGALQMATRFLQRCADEPRLRLQAIDARHRALLAALQRGQLLRHRVDRELQFLDLRTTNDEASLPFGSVTTFDARPAEQLARRRHEAEVRARRIRMLQRLDEHDAPQQPRKHATARVATASRTDEVEQRARRLRQRQERAGHGLRSELFLDEQQHAAEPLLLQFLDDARGVRARVHDERLHVGAERGFERRAVLEIDLEQIDEPTTKAFRLRRQHVLGPLVEAFELRLHRDQRLAAAVDRRQLAPQLGLDAGEFRGFAVRIAQVREDTLFALAQETLTREEPRAIRLQVVALRLQLRGLARHHGKALSELIAAPAGRAEASLLIRCRVARARASMQQLKQLRANRLTLGAQRSQVALRLGCGCLLFFQLAAEINRLFFARGELVARRVERSAALHALARQRLAASATAFGFGSQVIATLRLRLGAFALRVEFAADSVALCARRLQRLCALRDGRIRLRDAIHELFAARDRRVERDLELCKSRALIVQRRAQLRALDHRDRAAQVAQRRLQLLESPRLAGLNSQAANAAAALLQQVGDAREVLVRALELAQRLLLLQLEARDAGRFFEDRATRLRVCGQHRVDAALFHHRVAAGSEAGVEQHVAHVLETHFGAVQQVGGFLLEREATRDVDLRATLELPFGILERDRHFGHAHGLAAFGALEDDVGHLGAAQALGALVAEHPLDGVHNVGLAAAVGADDAGQPRVELELGAVGEGLEATGDETLEAHEISPSSDG